ncbi:RES domain-containing protein [Namhaeicola litoreus]|uniref:RES domain-containing protein n=1 Tax=Namhaeicola litoreus TaxID=1052145 RepID=A0ABW3Y6S1_9FLAO
MTDLEKQLESRFPELEILEKRIAELNSMDLSKISVAELRDKINDYFPIINFGEVKWDSRYHLFRVRRNLNNTFDKPFESLKKIGLRPAEGTPFGRANNENQAVFYGSNEGDLALFESCQNLKENQRFEPQNFTMGVWKVKDNQKIRLVPIVDSELAQNNRPDIQKANQLSDKLIAEQLSSEKIKKGSKLISEFFAEQFAKSEIKSPNDYKISSFFSDYIKNVNDLSRVKFDGILYPSVAHKYRAENVALFPESLDKLEFVKCLSITCYNFRFDEGKLTKGIIREGKLKGTDELIWE